MMKKIRKAIFPVAGFGTRFLPVTKSMPKELLPIIDKPLIQYAVEEAISAGIDTLIFVTGRNKRAIEDHFDRNVELENILRAKGKDKQLEMVRNILPKGVECIFVRQPEQLGLGHAILCAERIVGDEPFAVLLADDFITSTITSTTFDLIEAYKSSGKTQLSVMQVDGPDISKYGVIKRGINNGPIIGLIEKPKFKNAPSNMASIGRYILNPNIFEIIKNQPKGSGGEIQLSDAMNTPALQGEVEAVKLRGKRFDCGDVRGYLDAITYTAEFYKDL